MSEKYNLQHLMFLSVESDQEGGGVLVVTVITQNQTTSYGRLFSLRAGSQLSGEEHWRIRWTRLSLERGSTDLKNVKPLNITKTVKQLFYLNSCASKHKPNRSDSYTLISFFCDMIRSFGKRNKVLSDIADGWFFLR